MTQVTQVSQVAPEQRSRAERIALMARQARSGTRAALVATAVLGLMIVPAVGWWSFGIWALCMVVAYRMRDLVVQRVVRCGTATERDENLVAMSAVALAVVIAMPGPVFMPLMSPDVRGLYTAVQVGWVAIAAFVIGIHPRSYALYVLISYSLLAFGWWRILPAQLAMVVVVMLGVAGFVLTTFARRLTVVFNESVQMRHENEGLVAQLTASIAETAQAQRARSRFLAAASHDLLQPVHALMLLVGVLRDSNSSATRDQAARRIELTTTSIASMFRGLLDQARLDAGAVLPRLEPVALETVCRGIEAAYALRCQDKGLSLSVACGADVRVTADAALLDRVLRNLVDNAVKFTEQGRVSMTVTRHRHRVLVEVVDTGVGIVADEQPRVFDAFFRGSSATGQGIEGVGLGLSITLQLVELMGGQIHLASTLGVGTRVQVWLTPTESARPAAVATPAVPRELAYQRVLVVEDDRAAREALHLWLADRGGQVVSVASLAEALEVCTDSGFVPDYLLSDLHLGDGPDGLQALAALRARFGPLPAALITGDAIDASAVPAGVNLVRKPLRPAELERLLQRHSAAVERGT